MLESVLQNSFTCIYGILSKIERLRFLSWWQIVLKLDRSDDVYVESTWPVNLQPSNVCLSGYSRDFENQLVRFCSSALLGQDSVRAVTVQCSWLLVQIHA